MKLEDEIQVIFDDEFNTHPYSDDEIKAIEKIKSLIERYCKRQRELCAYAVDENYDLMVYQNRAEICGCILHTKLATEE